MLQQNLCIMYYKSNKLEPGTADEELSNDFHISLRRCDFWLLRDTEWLNDKVKIIKLLFYDSKY